MKNFSFRAFLTFRLLLGCLLEYHVDNLCATKSVAHIVTYLIEIIIFSKNNEVKFIILNLDKGDKQT